MAYETYTTEAIVCGAIGTREHDATLRLLTRDAGMVYARAGGVRADKSKLRYGLQEFSHVRVTLVRGRSDWRVTGAVALRNFYFEAENRGARATVLSAMRAVRRLIHGSEAHPELFEVIADGLAKLSRAADVRGEQLFLLRLLHYLGYVPPAPAYASLLHAPSLDDACAHYDTLDASREIQSAIDHALTVSHL